MNILGFYIICTQRANNVNIGFYQTGNFVVGGGGWWCSQKNKIFACCAMQCVCDSNLSTYNEMKSYARIYTIYTNPMLLLMQQTYILCICYDDGIFIILEFVSSDFFYTENVTSL